MNHPPAPAAARPSAPRFEHHRKSIGIGEASPRLSWKTVAAPGWTQSAYEIEITRDRAAESTGRIESAEQLLVAWPVEPLASREQASVRVRLWNAAGEPTAWSASAVVEAGLLAPGDWSAEAIGADWAEPEDKDLRRPPLVRHEFNLDKPIAKARLYASAHGVYELELNGERVGVDALNPGWTVYDARLRYHTYDVTALVMEGANAIGGWLGDGWYRGRLGFSHHGPNHDCYGSDLSLIAQLEVEFEDGTTATVATDGAWKAGVGPIVKSGLYDGETYDARDEQDGWSSAGFDESRWTAAAVHPANHASLIAPEGPPVRCTDDIVPVELLRTPSGRTVLDFGQNFAGRVRIDVEGERGTTVTIRTAEVVEDGEIYTRTLRGAKSTDVYTLRGDGREVWEPRFTIHGFRYADVEGWPGNIETDVAAGRIVGRVYHSDMERTGWFDSSNPLVNRLHENVLWSMRSNFVDVPTDCPQRDERLGWTGDIQVFAPTASFLFDASGFLSSWLKDLAVEQKRAGTVPWYVPVIPGGPMWTPIRPGAVWGDVAVLCPWTLYERFGDDGVLAEQYESAKAWVDQVNSLAGPDHLWNEGFQLGDWLDPAAPPDDPADARTDKYLVATAYFAWSTARLADTAEVIGKADDARHYRELAGAVRDAFVKEYWLPEASRLTSDAQTAYALAIQFKLLDRQDALAAGERMAELVAEDHNRIATGFAGVNLVSDALSSTGQSDAAYDLLLERECPSWLYMVDQGATTIWERWDSRMPDGNVNPGRMTSFNHYALGSVADWMHRVVAGIEPTSPGYRTIRFAPRPGGDFTSASAAHETPYGRASIAWTLDGETLSVTVDVPTGTTAVVDVPGLKVYTVESGRHETTSVVR
ncbi:alpha-L-rhamnosidase [Cryobacterium sp. Hh7]|nr:alpha-L-rhamnosidase [Cryobacterium sp. Hh7]